MVKVDGVMKKIDFGAELSMYIDGEEPSTAAPYGDWNEEKARDLSLDPAEIADLEDGKTVRQGNIRFRLEWED